ncbi:MAG: chemotaxis protein CheW [Thermoleophilaceae bacterium]|nr:chemotaxis protein CheW [Thermoleophilaceae bacterium]
MADTKTSSETTAGLSAHQLVVFSVQGEQYALPITAVREVIRYEAPRSVVTTLPALRGVINLRGSIVPVYDLRPLLGLGDAADAGAKTVIATVDGEVFGLIVDQVSEVLTLESDSFESAPSGAHAAVAAVARHSERLIVLLEPRQLALALGLAEDDAEQDK